MKLKDLILFMSCSLIWGTTWYVIKFQIDEASAIVSVFYRFLIASILMFSFNYFITKKSLIYPSINHLIFFLHGVFNFSINYILTYIAEEKITSGMVAVTFTSLIYFNMIGMWFWFKKPITKNIFIGGILGFLGILFLFWKEMSPFQLDSKAFSGIIIGIIATLSASSGNMFAFRNHQLKVPVIVFNSFGMLYGAIFSLIIGLIWNENYSLPTSFSFLTSLLYLSTFGTVIAFWAYQTLVGTLGADRAAYTSTISPIIAIIISSFFENVVFTPIMFVGIFLCIVGNIIALGTNKKTWFNPFTEPLSKIDLDNPQISK